MAISDEAIRLAIGQWLEAKPPENLGNIDAPHGDRWTNKAGILPFIPHADINRWQVLTLRPQPKKPMLGPPPLQLCKGTRMGLRKKKWKDIKEQPDEKQCSQLETAAETALREAHEEIGLLPEHCLKLWNAGQVIFMSASTGKEKPLDLTAVHVRADAMLLPEADLIEDTLERRWCTLPEFMQHGRADHASIAQKVVSALVAAGVKNTA